MNAEITLREGFVLPFREGDVLQWNAVEVEWHNRTIHTKSAEWAVLKPGNRLHVVMEVWHENEKLLERRLFSGSCFNCFAQCIDLRPFQKKFGMDSSFLVKAFLLAYNDDGVFEDGEYKNGILLARTEKMFVPWKFPAKLARRMEIQYIPGFNTEHALQGNYYPRFGDVDNDGVYEVFFSQGTLGQMMYRLDGTLLWEYRSAEGLCEDMRPDSETAIYDIDGDGFAEVICCRKFNGKIHICIVNGRTGELKRSVEWPRYFEREEGGRRSALRIANLRGGPVPRDIVASQDYTHMTAFDDRLDVLWDIDPEGQVRYPANWFANAEGYPYKNGLGHSPIFCDIDGDGREEFLWGATLFSSEGKVIWSRSDLRMVGNRDDEHIDCPRFVDPEDNGNLKIYFSSGGYLLDLQGNVLLSLEKLGYKIIHGQRAAMEKIVPGSAEKQIIQMDFHNREFGCSLMVFDREGKLLWHKPIQRSFALGNWTGAPEKSVFLADKKNIYTTVVDGNGGVQCMIPARMYLWESVVADVCGDTRDKFVTPVVTSDGRVYLDIYECASKSLNPDERNVEFRRNDSKFWNWTAF